MSARVDIQVTEIQNRPNIINKRFVSPYKHVMAPICLPVYSFKPIITLFTSHKMSSSDGKQFKLKVSFYREIIRTFELYFFSWSCGGTIVFFSFSVTK